MFVIELNKFTQPVKNPINESVSKENWMGEAEIHLKGFSWRSGSARAATEIIVRSDTPLHTLEILAKMYRSCYWTLNVFSMMKFLHQL